MRLTPQRLLLRAVLLLAAGGLAVTRAVEDGRQAVAPGLEPDAARFHSRLALVEWILAGLALLTALFALLALRRPARRRLLHLDVAGRGDASGPAGGPGQAGTPPREPAARREAPTVDKEPP